MSLLKFVFTVYAAVTMITLLTDALALPYEVCGKGKSPLAGYFCGHTPDRRECPSTHRCVVAPNDAYAVCCPNSQKDNKETVISSIDKEGSCPPPSGMFGICIAACSTDRDCGGNQKCCGSCPRTCVQPVF